MLLDHMIPIYHYAKNFMVIIDQEYCKNEDPVFPEDALIWFTDGSRVVSGRGW
jgi:hypothetical protein